MTVSGGASDMTAKSEMQTIDGEDVTVYVIEIENNPGVLLPATGGPVHGFTHSADWD